MPKVPARKPEKPTTQDAAVLLQLASLGRDKDLHDAMNWMWSDGFPTDYAEFVKAHPPGSVGYGRARLIAIHYETIGTLWKHRLINERLLFDWLLVTAVWDRTKGFVLGQRREFKEPALGENFQKMANAQARLAKASGKR